MKFDVVIGSWGFKKFKKITFLNGDSCIKGTPEGSEITENKENISVIYPDDKRVIPYPSVEHDKVLYPVKVGNCIIVNKKVDGTLYSNAYRVISMTDTDVICGPVE